jgi:O-antigen/teichoic acid export membrane protein
MNQLGNKKLYKLTLYSGVFKTALTIIIGIITVPFTLSYLGTEKYGVWNVITSFIVFLTMTNLGLNSAASILINKNANFLTKLQILKRSARVLITVIPIILLILFFINYYYPEWFKIVHSPSNIENEAKISAIIMIVFTLINIPFSLTSSALNGFQKNYIENIFGIITILLSTTCLFFVIHFKKNLIFYAYLSSLSLLALNMIKLLYLQFIIVKFKTTNENILDEHNYETSYKHILITGYRCMLGALASMFVLNTDNIVIAKYVGINHVTSFSVTYKLYTTVFSIIYLLNSSIVPIIGKNIANKNYINYVYKNTLFLVVIFGGLFWVGTLSIGKSIIYLWVGEKGYAGVYVLFFLGAYSYIFSIVNLNYVLINTLNLLKGVVYITWLEGILNLILSIFLGKHFGLSGIALGTFLGTFISPFIIFPIILKKRTNNLISQNNNFIKKHFLFSLAPTIIIAYIISVHKTIIAYDLLYTFILCLIYLFLSYICLPISFRKFITDYMYNNKFIVMLKNK